MEYTFKNSLAEKPITLVLNEYSIAMRTGGREKIIPYGDIQSVCLKRSGRKFFTIIKATNQPEIYIGNHYWLSGNETDDKSRELCDVHQGFALSPAREKPGLLCLRQQPAYYFDHSLFFYNRGLLHFIYDGKFSGEPIQQHCYFLGFINAGHICDSLVEHGPLSKGVYTRKYSVAIFAFQLNANQLF